MRARGALGMRLGRSVARAGANFWVMASRLGLLDGRTSGHLRNVDRDTSGADRRPYQLTKAIFNNMFVGDYNYFVVLPDNMFPPDVSTFASGV